MNPKLLAKLTARGVRLDGARGQPELTAMDIAASLSACTPRSYLALASKWMDDELAQAELQAVLAGVLLQRMLRGKLKHPDGYIVGSRLAAKLVYLQFIDGYRCQHCNGAGEIDNKVCGNCKGSSLGVFSEEFRSIYLEVSGREYARKWRQLIDEMEMEVNAWEGAGWAALEAAIG